MEVENKVDYVMYGGVFATLQTFGLWLIENVSNLVLVMLKNKLSHTQLS